MLKSFKFREQYSSFSLFALRVLNSQNCEVDLVSSLKIFDNNCIARLRR